MSGGASYPGPVFVVGAPRSGTTLLQYMLRSHPRISMPSGESHFFIPIHARRAQYGDLRDAGALRRLLEDIYAKAQGFIDGDLHGLRFDAGALAEQCLRRGADSVPAVIDALLRINAEGEGKARWGDKTPYYALHLDALAQMFPDLQVVHIVRDGRDCALSMLERSADLGIFNIRDAAVIWRRYVGAAHASGQRLGGERYLMFHYESLLADPRAVMQEVCTFLGEPYDEALVDFRKPKTPGKTPLLQRPVQGDNAGKWRAGMAPWQVRVFESVAGASLRRFGYETSGAPRGPSPLLELGLRVHSRASGWLLRTRRRYAR